MCHSAAAAAAAAAVNAKHHRAGSFESLEYQHLAKKLLIHYYR